MSARTSRVTTANDVKAPGRGRATSLYTLAAVLSLVGLADAIYLTVEHLTGRGVRCTVAAGCSEVLSSQYAAPGGVPLAAVGAAAYFTAFSCATLAAFGYRRAQSLLAIIVVPMFLVTLGLLFIQAFVLRAFCDYCLLSAAVTLCLTGVVATQLMQGHLRFGLWKQ